MVGITFPCACGCLLRMPPGSSGRRGRCPRCGHVAVTPGQPADRSAGETALQPAPAAAEPALSRPAPLPLCSICQCRIDGAEPQVACPACQLPFHEECWQQNRGCSAYGCSQVGKEEPCLPAELPELPGPAAEPPAAEDFPLEHLLLGLSVLLFLLSLVSWGLFSLAGLWYAHSFCRLLWPEFRHRGVVIVAGLVCVAGVGIGLYVSSQFWL